MPLRGNTPWRDVLSPCGQPGTRPYLHLSTEIDSLGNGADVIWNSLALSAPLQKREFDEGKLVSMFDDIRNVRRLLIFIIHPYTTFNFGNTFTPPHFFGIMERKSHANGPIQRANFCTSLHALIPVEKSNGISPLPPQLILSGTGELIMARCLARA